VVQAESRARAVTISIDADDEDQIIKKELRKEQKLIQQISGNNRHHYFNHMPVYRGSLLALPDIYMNKRHLIHQSDSATTTKTVKDKAKI